MLEPLVLLEPRARLGVECALGVVIHLINLGLDGRRHLELDGLLLVAKLAETPLAAPLALRMRSLPPLPS